MNNQVKILLLCGNTNRAKSYVSILSSIKDAKFEGLIYGIEEREKNKEKIIIDDSTKSYLNNINCTIPNLNIDIRNAFDSNKWKYKVSSEKDVNSQLILDKIKDVEADIVIFAGYGGQILSKNHFFGKSKYIHCHPGWLPEERGSTTLYYSLLNNSNLSVTAFFMTAEIDQGYMLLRKSFDIPGDLVNIDVWVDNCLRATCLFEALELLIKKKDYQGFLPSSNDKDCEYYVIHPLLKHLALLSLKTN